MLDITIDSKDHMITVQPEGKVSKQDFQKLGQAINDFARTHDRAPNLLITSSSLPDWDSFSSFFSHMKLLKDNQSRIAKIAIVSDNRALSILPTLADHISHASIRHFPAGAKSAAKSWLVSEGDHPGALEIIRDVPDNVVHVEAHGIITAQDYQNTLIPEITKKLESFDKLNILFVTAADFQSYSAGAFWDDARFGLTNLSHFDHIALVTDVDWIRHGAKLFGPFISGKLHLFSLKDMAGARSWVGASGEHIS